MVFVLAGKGIEERIVEYERQTQTKLRPKLRCGSRNTTESDSTHTHAHTHIRQHTHAHTHTHTHQTAHTHIRQHTHVRQHAESRTYYTHASSYRTGVIYIELEI